MTSKIADSVYTDRLLAAVASAFGIMALILTAVGLYGVIAYVVGRRTVEIGIRMALGATGGNVISMVLREVGLLIVIGAAMGMVGTVLAGRAVSSQLFGMGGFDPILLAGTVAVMGSVALLAGFFPALRASRIEPLSALRHD